MPADLSAEPRCSSFNALLQDAAALGTVPVAVVHPCDALSLQGALQAARVGLIEPILVGPQAKIRRAADLASLDISASHIEDVPHSHAAAARAVGLVRSGTAVALMKGALHTDELMAERETCSPSR